MKFEIKQGDESLTSHSGLALIGVLLHKTQLDNRLNAVFLPDHPHPEISHGTIAKSMIGLLCLGKPDFEAIEPFRADSFFSTSLNLSAVPSEGSLRQRLNDAQGRFDVILKEESADLIKRHAPQISPCHKKYVPLDIDVSPFDNSGTKKEGVSWTYKKVAGYAPILAYLGEEGYWINSQLREGKQHCQNGTPEFLRETIALAKRATSSPLLVRMDSGNDSLDNIQVCLDEKVNWLIKRNLRQESVETWLEIAKTTGTVHVPRMGKVVYRGDIEVVREGVEKALRQVFEVTVRTIDAKGQMLLEPKVNVDTYETSLPDAPETIVALYHAHGTSEQFHSEIKSDMDMERLPSGKFATNSVVLLLGMVAYNCLRLCGQEALRDKGIPVDERAPIRKEVFRRRLRSVMQDLIYMASRVVTHARKLGLAFGRWNPWYPVWRRIYERFAGA
jgi:hypothetical protein